MKHKRTITIAAFALVIAMLTLATVSFMPERSLTIRGIGAVSFESKVIISVGGGIVLAAAESLPPTGQVTWTNLDDSYTVIDDDPDNPGGDWADAVDETSDTIAHVSFNTPTGNPTQGANLQNFKVYARKTATAGTNPTIVISLYENGGEITAGSAVEVTSETGQLFTFTWDAAALSNADGSGVECYILGDASTGKPANRRSVDIDACEWNVDYSACTPNISNTPSSWNFGTASCNTSYWSSGSAPTFPLDDGECHFTVTNSSGGTIDITVTATDFAGGNGWTLASSPGEDTVTMKAGKSGDSVEGDMVILATSSQSFISGLADTASKKWELKLETATLHSDSDNKTSTVTLTATCQ